MNDVGFKSIVDPYKTHQIKKMTIAAASGALSYAALTGLHLPQTLEVLAGIAGMCSFLYLLLEGFIKSFGMSCVRLKNHKSLKAKGILDDAMAELENAVCFHVDKQCFAVTQKYLCLPHGVILELDQIAWLYSKTQVVRWFYIPVIKISSCQIKLLDGINILAFFGKMKDTQAFNRLLVVLRSKIPELLIGYTAENRQKYQYLCAKHKDN